MVTGFSWWFLHGGNRLRLIVLILFWGFARQDFLIGRGYGVLGFSSVLCIYGYSIKATWWWFCPQYITVSGRLYHSLTCLSLRVLYSLGKSGAADEYTAIVGLNLWSSACRSDCLQVHSFPGSKFYLFWKNATPERFEFRFNPLNRNVLVKPKPNLLLSCDNRRFWSERETLRPCREPQARLAGERGIIPDYSYRCKPDRTRLCRIFSDIPLHPRPSSVPRDMPLWSGSRREYIYV